MDALRTPEDRFAAVSGFDYQPKYVTLGDGLRMAYVEHGPADGEPVILMHGEPTWSYLWRTVIPALAGAGAGVGRRVIVPDLIGFGRSDKPVDRDAFTYAQFVEWCRDFAFDALDLRGVTWVGHDWGGLIGLRLAAEHPERFARFVATNTGMPTGDQPMPDVWLRFRAMSRTAPVFDVPRLVQTGCATELSPEVLAAYDAPFPDESYKAAVRVMPDLVPAEPDNPAAPANRAAWQRLSTWDKPFLCAFNGDPITGGMGKVIPRLVPGVVSVTLPGTGHFLQEDTGPALGAAIAQFLDETAKS
jgi:haloalkane dehalogenase